MITNILNADSSSIRLRWLAREVFRGRLAVAVHQDDERFAAPLLPPCTSSVSPASKRRTGVSTRRASATGAKAETISDNANVRAATREKALKFAQVTAEKIKDAVDEISFAIEEGEMVVVANQVTIGFRGTNLLQDPFLARLEDARGGGPDGCEVPVAAKAKQRNHYRLAPR
mgnify:CR=1 FL=1